MNTNRECQLRKGTKLMMADVVNVAKLTRLEELLVVSVQVIADKIACENVYNVFLGVGNEFQCS